MDDKVDYRWRKIHVARVQLATILTAAIHDNNRIFAWCMFLDISGIKQDTEDVAKSR